MHQKPLLSIVFTIRNQRNIIEPALSALYDNKSLPFELIVMDDASTDGSSDAVQSLLDYYQHDQTYYFDHPEPLGRGNCLNEALHQCNGSILWIPSSIQQIDKKKLKEAFTQLNESDYTYLLMGDSLPQSRDEWLTQLNQNMELSDGDILWNLPFIPSTQRFFDPYITEYHSLELAARLNEKAHSLMVEAWYDPVQPGALARTRMSSQTKAELAYTLLRQAECSTKERTLIHTFLDNLDYSETARNTSAFDNELLAEAYKMRLDGRFSAALDLVGQVLKQEPGNQKAKQLKIEILERKRRFVEASELKHELETQGKKEKNKQADKAPSDPVKTSIIIPTALYGKPALEHCLVSISEYCDSSGMELIVIDNASLDDTHDYLKELEDKQFLNCSVITNSKNKGLGASINQGLEAARGDYACIIHNDVEFRTDVIGELEQLMETYPQFAVIGPLANRTLNPDQAIQSHGEETDELLQTEYLDSFCMMVRMKTRLKMDEAYKLAFFEDIDFCFEARAAGYKIGIAPQLSVTHHFGTTTFALNLDTESDQYWKNVSYFNEKWGVDVYSEEELKSKSTFDQLLALDDIVNPVYPEDTVTSWFECLFTDELKTEMLKAEHDAETLCKLVHLMMVMEQREVMRKLEDRLDHIELPASLTYQLIRFYFNRNIYSRCLHYLDRLKAEQRSLQSELYKLQIWVNDKELDKAVPKLKQLLDEAPSNPTLYKLAGDIYHFEGNEEESASFYRIASQINPFEYNEEGMEELRIKN